MKTIKIKKGKIFSDKSRVYINVGTNKIHIKGFGLHALSISEDDFIYASHFWTKSNILKYQDINEESIFLIKPRFGRYFTIFVGIIFVLCTCVFLFYRSRWSFIPLGIIAIYISLFLTVLKDKYLIIEQIKEIES